MKKFRIALLLYVAFDFLVLGNTAGLLPLTPMLAAQTSVNVPNYPPIRATPDCLIQGTFTATGPSTIYDNRGNGCTTWHLVYSNTGFSALNIALQSADDSGGTPSAFANWGTSGGTLAVGTTLPLTATTAGQATGYKYRPYVQVNLSSATGTGRVWYMAYGYRPGIADSSSAAGLTAAVQGAVAAGSSGASVNPVAMGAYQSAGGNVQDFVCGNSGGTQCGFWQLVTGADGLSNANISTGYNPGNGGATVGISTVPNLFNGASWDRQIYCPTTSKINALGAATVALVAPVAGKKSRICSITISNNNATATTLKVVEGTGATCGTGTTDLSALLNIGGTSTAPVSIPITPGNPWTVNSVGDGACLTGTAASSVEVTYTWEQH